MLSDAILIHENVVPLDRDLGESIVVSSVKKVLAHLKHENKPTKRAELISEVEF